MSIELLKKSLKEDEVVYGFDSTMTNLKHGKVEKIFLAKNCPQELKKEIVKYANVE